MEAGRMAMTSDRSAAEYIAVLRCLSFRAAVRRLAYAQLPMHTAFTGFTRLTGLRGFTRFREFTRFERFPRFTGF
jgi:hypothetical protein